MLNLNRKLKLFAKISSKENEILLKHFISHYRRLGVGHFYIMVHLKNPRFVKLLAAHDGVEVLEVMADKFEDRKIINKLNGYKQAIAGKNEWCFHVDIDEFVNMNNRQVTSIMQCNADYVKGVLVDCVGRDGRLDSVSDLPLETTFPIRCNLTHAMGGNTTKIPLSRGKVMLKPGYHGVESDGVPYKEIVHVRHYKWTKSLLPKIMDRLTGDVEFVPPTRSWKKELERARDIVNTGKIDLAIKGLEIYD